MRIDMHLHTSRYSVCSKLDADRLVKQAIKAGLDGVVITEHHHVWNRDELDALLEAVDEPNFLLVAGFEYTSSQGDILVYGLEPEQAGAFAPGKPPEEVIAEFNALGAACVAAHPTRAGLGFDKRIAELPLDAMEVQSVNLKEHEQRLALSLSESVGIAPVTCSDAHRLDDVGRYATEFLDPIRTIADFRDALKDGRFRAVGAAPSGVKSA